ncbi:MAG: hypothetical protein QOH96_1519, partial [Blastocatellia bacterium]|nr:hypothetical protein [Blastocatellia bacterium]
ATAGTDYTATSGTVTFNAGEQVKTIPVTILASGSVVDKTFLVNISGATGGTIIRPQAKGTIKATRTPSIAVISEFRTSGPGGAGDDFVEVYNNTATPLTVGGTGWAVVKSGASCGSSPQIVGIIPNGTVIPVGGHYLLTGSQYSLGAPNGYPAGTAGSGKAVGDLVMTSDIDADSNIGLFSASTVPALSSTNLLDAAGSGTGNICDLLEEGTPLLPALGSSSEYSFVRKLTTGFPLDTDNNFTDFAVVSTTPTTPVGSNAAPLLGAPGPENLSSPPSLSGLTSGLIDPAQVSTASPNRVRDTSPYTDNLSNTGAYPLGTFVIRRSYTNNTGHPVTRLRFRLIDITAFPSPAGTADLRGITSPASQAVTITGGGSVTVIGTALEPSPGGFPAQPNGGGINSSMTVPLGLPLANGQSINVQWLLGVKQGGTFRFFVLIEGLAP